MSTQMVIAYGRDTLGNYVPLAVDANGVQTIAGIVNANSALPTAQHYETDVAIVSGNSAVILAANVARKNVMIRVALASAGVLRLSNAANKGVSIDAGGYVMIDGAFDITGYALGGNVTVEISWFG